MDERAVARAWDAELAMFKGVLGAQCGPGTDPREVHQAATGVLLLRSLPTGRAFDVAVQHVRSEAHERRNEPEMMHERVLEEYRAMVALLESVDPSPWEGGALEPIGRLVRERDEAREATIRATEPIDELVRLVREAVDQHIPAPLAGLLLRRMLRYSADELRADLRGHTAGVWP